MPDMIMRGKYVAKVVTDFGFVPKRDDLISRAAAIDALTNTNIKMNFDSVYDGEIHRTKRAAIRIVVNLPTVDAAPVVRCRDCKNWETDWKPNHSIDGEHFCPMISLVTSGEWFCAYGERRDSE